MSGLADKAKGKFEEVAGKITDDKTQEAKGKARQAVGEMKDKADDTKDAAHDKVEETMDAARDEMNERTHEHGGAP